MYILFRIGIYLGILVCLHYTYEYLKKSLTTKKTKDLVMIHQEKYQEILNELRTPHRIDGSTINLEDPPADVFPTDQTEFLQQSLLSMVDSEEYT
jgi:hypothetical protein